MSLPNSAPSGSSTPKTFPTSNETMSLNSSLVQAFPISRCTPSGTATPKRCCASDGSILPSGQLCDEPVDEFVQRCSAGRPDDELRQAGVQVAVELAVQLIPAGGDQLARVDVWTTPAHGRRQFRRQLPVGDGQRDAEVIGFDLSAGIGCGPVDRLTSRPRLARGEETPQPPI